MSSKLHRPSRTDLGTATAPQLLNPSALSKGVGPPKKMSPFKRLMTAVKSKLKLSVPRSVSDSHECEAPTTVFGVPIRESIVYAGAVVNLHTPGQEACHLPLLLALCGRFLNENGTHTVGIFRVSGSIRRIQEIHDNFDCGPNYGADLDWSHYTVHDVASIFRRYLTLLPEPVIPIAHYYAFREVLDQHADEDLAFQIDAYRRLVANLPESERLVLLYVISLLGHFSRFAEFTRMDTPNLAAIFQPGLLVHPLHTLSPEEYKRSQRVVEFLIAHHENFVVPFPSVTLVAIPADSYTPSDANSVAEASAAGIVGTNESVTTSGLAGRSTRSSRKSMRAQRKMSRPYSHYMPNPDDEGATAPGALAQNLSRAVSSPSNATLNTGHLSRIRRGRGTRENLHGPPNVRRAVTDYLYSNSRNASHQNGLSQAGDRVYQPPRSHVAPPPGTAVPSGSPVKGAGRQRSAKTLYTSIGRGTNVIFSTQPSSLNTSSSSAALESGLNTVGSRRGETTPLRQVNGPWVIQADDPSRPHSQVLLTPVGSDYLQAAEPIPIGDANHLVRSPSADQIHDDPLQTVDVRTLATPMSEDLPTIPVSQGLAAEMTDIMGTLQPVLGKDSNPIGAEPLSPAPAALPSPPVSAGPTRPLPPATRPSVEAAAADSPVAGPTATVTSAASLNGSSRGSVKRTSFQSLVRRLSRRSRRSTATDAPNGAPTIPDLLARLEPGNHQPVVSPPSMTAQLMRRLSREARSTFGQLSTFSNTSSAHDSTGTGLRHAGPPLSTADGASPLGSTSFASSAVANPVDSATFRPRSQS
ncbi:GTPase activating protein (GAP) for Rho1p [Tieghemiomyces parasiticus]|uniref:GTPase activating protein (GAP) for Rho1p n=1 Tax=Tieghemiomyces parasiticus TaxID=78921 RepID=A0A9W8E2G1_9FUNG|nr:GTPase activating protein (GAP) for Rho1p [Tieghemiomyces parasiticus]